MVSKPPTSLGASGRALWRHVVSDVPQNWELDQRDLANLASACAVTDRVAQLEELVTEGLLVRGSKGQDRLNPAIPEIRQSRALVTMLLSKVETVPPTARTGHLSGRQRAQLRRAESGNNGAA
jgi:phage terminase small subunit